MKITIILLISLASACASCKLPSSLFSDQYSWLEGDWLAEIEGGYFLESWEKQDDSTFLATCYFLFDSTIAADDSISVSKIRSSGVQTENVQLRMRNSVVVYAPVSYGQNNDKEVPFTLTSYEGGIYTFENPSHDFPKKIVYKKIDMMHTEVTVSGKTTEGEQELFFAFTKHGK